MKIPIRPLLPRQNLVTWTSPSLCRRGMCPTAPGPGCAWRSRRRGLAPRGWRWAVPPGDPEVAPFSQPQAPEPRPTESNNPVEGTPPIPETVGPPVGLAGPPGALASLEGQVAMHPVSGDPRETAPPRPGLAPASDLHPAGSVMVVERMALDPGMGASRAGSSGPTWGPTSAMGLAPLSSAPGRQPAASPL